MSATVLQVRRIIATLHEQQADSTKLDAAVAANLEELPYGG